MRSQAVRLILDGVQTEEERAEGGGVGLRSALQGSFRDRLGVGSGIGTRHRFTP